MCSSDLPFHVLAHFKRNLFVARHLFEHFHPALQRGERGAQLVSGFFGHAGPNLVLRTLVAGADGNERYDDEKRYNQQLNDGEVTDLFQQYRFAVIHQIVFGWVERILPDDRPCG